MMVNARRAVQTLGGIDQVNSYTKVYLAMLNLQSWDRVPAIPPEVVLLPRFFYINIYEISYWSRAILIPLSILYAKWTGFSNPNGLTINELLPSLVAEDGEAGESLNAENEDPAADGDSGGSAAAKADGARLHRYLSLIHISRCRRRLSSRTRWSPYH